MRAARWKAKFDGHLKMWTGLDRPFAESFVEAWLAAWNRHDLQAILCHYSEGFEMHSPVIRKMMGEQTGILKGKLAVGQYWGHVLDVIPDLRFEWVSWFLGVDSLVIHYIGHRGQPVAEVFHFDETGQVSAVFAHYGNP
jgi:hypothetical protein